MPDILQSYDILHKYNLPRKVDFFFGRLSAAKSGPESCRLPASELPRRSNARLQQESLEQSDAKELSLQDTSSKSQTQLIANDHKVKSSKSQKSLDRNKRYFIPELWSEKMVQYMIKCQLMSQSQQDVASCYFELGFKKKNYLNSDRKPYHSQHEDAANHPPNAFPKSDSNRTQVLYNQVHQKLAGGMKSRASQHVAIHQDPLSPLSPNATQLALPQTDTTKKSKKTSSIRKEIQRLKTKLQLISYMDKNDQIKTECERQLEDSYHQNNIINKIGDLTSRSLKRIYQHKL